MMYFNLFENMKGNEDKTPSILKELHKTCSPFLYIHYTIPIQ